MAQSASPAHPPSHSSCHTLRRVLVRHSTMNLITGAMTPTGQEWTTRACDVPLFSDLERATGVCTSCASGWSHPENHPLVPVFDAAAHARFSLGSRHRTGRIARFAARTENTTLVPIRL